MTHKIHWKDAYYYTEYGGPSLQTWHFYSTLKIDNTNM